MVQKKEWAIPQTFVQQFAANEYVAACGDGGTVYKFKCEAGGGVPGDVYLESNSVAGLQTKPQGHWWEAGYVPADDYLGGYHACGVEHEAESTDPFLDGYYVVDDNVTPVIVWRGKWGANIHCTTNLNMNSWETAKS